MQNKANFRKAQTSVSSILAKDYKNERLRGHKKNKANPSTLLRTGQSQFLFEFFDFLPQQLGQFFYAGSGYC
jgi:hypothetical protein